MLGEIGRVVCLLGLATTLCAGGADPAHAGSPARESRQLLVGSETRQGSYLKLGRFAPAVSTEPKRDWMADWKGGWSSGVAAHSSASVDRTFMAVEAGREKAGLRGFVSAGGQSKSGELDPRFTANAYRHLGKIGVAENVVASASIGTGSVGERRFYAYTGSSRFSVGPLSFLGHASLVDTDLGRGFKRSWNARAEASWLLARRLDTKLAYEWSDPNDNRNGDERSRIAIRVDPLIHGQVRAGVGYRKLSGPANRPGSNADEVALELHVSF
jgi:hypothetical protein